MSRGGRGRRGRQRRGDIAARSPYYRPPSTKAGNSHEDGDRSGIDAAWSDTRADNIHAWKRFRDASPQIGSEGRSTVSLLKTPLAARYYVALATGRGKWWRYRNGGDGSEPERWSKVYDPLHIRVEPETVRLIDGRTCSTFQGLIDELVALVDYPYRWRDREQNRTSQIVRSPQLAAEHGAMMDLIRDYQADVLRLARIHPTLASTYINALVEENGYRVETTAQLLCGLRVVPVDAKSEVPDIPAHLVREWTKKYVEIFEWKIKRKLRPDEYHLAEDAAITHLTEANNKILFASHGTEDLRSRESQKRSDRRDRQLAKQRAQQAQQQRVEIRVAITLDDQILELVRGGFVGGVNQITEHLGRRKTDVSAAVKRLEAAGLVVRGGKNKNAPQMMIPTRVQTNETKARVADEYAEPQDECAEEPQKGRRKVVPRPVPPDSK